MFFIKNQLNDSFFDDINGQKLDKYQRKVVLDESNNLLVVAGAGSGKSLTIVAKIKYLIEKKGISASDILCLSFTNEAVNSLKSKINDNVNILTFHKLALQIIRHNCVTFTISSDTLLEYVIDEYFHGILLNSFKSILLMEYFHNDDIKKIVNSNNYQALKFNIISIIKKIKCNNLEIIDLYQIRKKCHNKDKILLIFALEILYLYEEELQSEEKMDFDDMIRKAKMIIENGGYIHKYQYIIIDEYQDISYMRFMLIKEIIQVTKAKLICVGDDYQSIYGFAGSKISLFLDFKKYFSNGKRIDIKNTYRNSYQLINITSRFIKKNKYQLRKNIKATFLLSHPIVIVYYDDLNKTYSALINYLYLEKCQNIMVLARYNNDFSKIHLIKDDVMNISYLTIHKAKGLECDDVILLKVSNEFMGFPSKIVENHIIEMIDNFDEEINYAEERRLFYVALTRCKKRVYLLVPRRNPSIFVEEIKSSCVELLL